ncbi:MAG: hypothetical protein ABIR18_15645 [Chitinophagaceae bacterium]
MKKNIVFAATVAGFIACLFAFTAPQSVISGSVLPPDGVESIWAMGEKDSAKAVILNTGSFSITVKSGPYKLVVDAKSPYKDLVLDLDVKPDQPMDVGQIVLQK